MNNYSSAKRQSVENEFDCFCKKALNNELKDAWRKNHSLVDKEILFSDLSCKELETLTNEDTYKIFNNHITVLNFIIYIENDHLYEALLSLKANKRNVILLRYWFGMDDLEISRIFNIPRSTVNYRRTSSMKEIQRYMEDN